MMYGSAAGGSANCCTTRFSKRGSEPAATSPSCAHSSRFPPHSDGDATPVLHLACVRPSVRRQWRGSSHTCASASPPYHEMPLGAVSMRRTHPQVSHQVGILNLSPNTVRFQAFCPQSIGRHRFKYAELKLHCVLSSEADTQNYSS
eukprot:4047044-Pleurochrysis_carterae.AAC.1